MVLSPSRYSVTARPVLIPPNNSKSNHEFRVILIVMPIIDGKSMIADVEYIQKARLGLAAWERVFLDRITKAA